MHPAVHTYLALLDTALPDAYTGVYLTGSTALGDWQPDRSDLDILTLTSRPLTEADLDALAAAHASVTERPYLDAIYVPLILGRAKAWRLGDDTITVPATDGVNTCHLIEAVIDHVA